MSTSVAQRTSSYDNQSAEPATAIAIAPMPASFLHRVRQEGIDDLGQPVKRLQARGGEPCRDVLRRAQPGENLILASFSPFTKPGPFHEYGPVYVLAENSGEEVARQQAPEAGSETDYLRDQFVVRAYSEDEEIVDAALIQAPHFAPTIERFLGRSDVAFLHVRYPTYGCFSCRIDRR